MAASFLVLAIGGGILMFAGGAGFIAGAILATGGLISISLLVASGQRTFAKAVDSTDEDWGRRF